MGNVKGYMRAAGWGKFNWEPEGDVEQVVILDPPISLSLQEEVAVRAIYSCMDSWPV